jgi:hypothetical protein
MAQRAEPLDKELNSNELALAQSPKSHPTPSNAKSK